MVRAERAVSCGRKAELTPLSEFWIAHVYGFFFFGVKGTAWLEQMIACEGLLKFYCPLQPSEVLQTGRFSFVNHAIVKYRWSYRALDYTATPEAVQTLTYVSLASYLLVKAAQISVLPHAAQDLRCRFHHLRRMSGRKGENKGDASFLQFTFVPKMIGTLSENGQ